MLLELPEKKAAKLINCRIDCWSSINYDTNLGTTVYIAVFLFFSTQQAKSVLTYLGYRRFYQIHV